MCEKNIILPFPLPSASTWKKKPCWSGGVEVKPNNGEVGRGDTRASLGLLGQLCVQPPILVSWSFRKVSPTYQWLSTGMEKLTISEWKFCSCEKQNEAQVLHVPDVFSERFLKKEGVPMRMLTFNEILPSLTMMSNEDLLSVCDRRLELR